MADARPTAGGDGRPAVDLTADPLPADLTVLVADDVAFTQRITETAWVASLGGNDATLHVQAWHGVDAQGVYALLAPIGAERVTIRGHPGYRYVSPQPTSGAQPEARIWWTEQPGLVVLVTSNNLYQPDELATLIEQLQPAVVDGLAAFNRSQGFADIDDGETAARADRPAWAPDATPASESKG